MNIKKPTSFIVLSASLIPGLAISAPLRSSNQSSLSPINNIQLGGGLLRNAKFPMNSVCLKSKKITVKSGLIKKTDMLTTVTTNELAKTLNLNLNTKGGWEKFSAGAEAEYINKTKANDYSLSFNYQNVIYGNSSLDHSEEYGVNALNPSAAAAYNTSPDNFIRKCGDSYAKEMKTGAILDITIQVHLSDKDQKNRFELSIKDKSKNIFNAISNIKTELDSYKYKGMIDVYAFQRGGSPSYLDDIYGLDSQQHRLRCNFQNIDACSKAVDDLINYVQATGKWSNEGFSNQVKLKDHQLEANSLYPISFYDATIGSYDDDFGLDIPAMVPQKQILKARESLNQLYDEYSNKILFSKDVIHSSGFKYLDDQIRQELETKVKTLASNLSIFTDGKAFDCFLLSSQDNCPMILKEIESDLIPVDYTLFEQLNGAYFVNINNSQPFVFVKNTNNDMNIYNTNLQLQTEIISHDIKLIPGSNFSYIALGGGYSIYRNGIQTRYYMDYYGSEDLVYLNPNGLGYSGTPPWNTCVNGNCSKINYLIEIIPF